MVSKRQKNQQTQKNVLYRKTCVGFIPESTVFLYECAEKKFKKALATCSFDEWQNDPFMCDFLKLEPHKFSNKYGITQEKLSKAAYNNFNPDPDEIQEIPAPPLNLPPPQNFTDSLKNAIANAFTATFAPQKQPN